MLRRSALAALLALGAAAPAAAQVVVTNFETPHVHPLDATPDGSLLLAVNTADARLEVFRASADALTPYYDVAVGLDPVSVRARSNAEAWVVNHVSDSVSVVDLVQGRVVATLSTDDEPADVVFAGNPERAFVSCSQANTVLVFDPADLAAPPARVALDGEDPRAMAVSRDGREVYVAIFESGNATTILGGGIDPAQQQTLAFPPNVVSDPIGPHGGVNPPPNASGSFQPPLNAGNPAPPRVGLVVRRDDQGRWRDDTGADWTDVVSGPDAAASGRPIGWDLMDHDVAVIRASTLQVSYANGLLNLVMALAVHPTDGRVTAVGTDAINEVRFEPNLGGRFLRVNLAHVRPDALGTKGVVDLNPHLDYSTSTVPQAERDRSLGDPRGIAWRASGDRGFVTGMGSNNVVVIDAAGARAGQHETIEVGQGPTGVVVVEAHGRAYVLNRFDASISILELGSETVVGSIGFFDPTPAAVRRGRPHLYDTHATSGLGHLSCASCHVDARMDRLAWDLGDPSGDMDPLTGQNLFTQLGGVFQPFHPMKGPMMTQTLQDIIGKEPHHWRGDRDGLEAFDGAFLGLLGDDQGLSAQEMQEFEDFLATIHFPPNPFRELDNSLPRDLPLDGHFTTGRFAPAGQPLPDGDALRGFQLYRPPVLLDGGALACVTCHTVPTGMSADARLVGLQYQPVAPGPNGERHHFLVAVDGSTNRVFKVPQMRNLYEKVGFDATQTLNRAGFGFLHDGSVDSLARFVAEPAFTVQSDQDVADLVAFLLAFSGSDLPQGGGFLNPPGTASRDAHAAVGRQTTVVDGSAVDPAQAALLAQMIAMAEAGDVGLVVKGTQAGLRRGWYYVGGDRFQSDRAQERVRASTLIASAFPGSELTFTVVPKNGRRRMGVDRDRDGVLDRDELDQGRDPADPRG